MTESIPIEKEKVSERIADIKHAVGKLKSYQGFSVEDLTNEEDKFSLAAYWLRIALEGVLTIGTHILSRLPSNNIDDFEEFIEHIEKFLQKQERK